MCICVKKLDDFISKMEMNLFCFLTPVGVGCPVYRPSESPQPNEPPQSYQSTQQGESIPTQSPRIGHQRQPTGVSSQPQPLRTGPLPRPPSASSTAWRWHRLPRLWWFNLRPEDGRSLRERGRGFAESAGLPCIKGEQRMGWWYATWSRDGWGARCEWRSLRDETDTNRWYSSLISNIHELPNKMQVLFFFLRIIVCWNEILWGRKILAEFIFICRTM